MEIDRCTIREALKNNENILFTNKKHSFESAFFSYWKMIQFISVSFSINFQSILSQLHLLHLVTEYRIFTTNFCYQIVYYNCK